MATRCAAAPSLTKRSGCTCVCSPCERASRTPRSCAKRLGTPNSSKSSLSNFMSERVVNRATKSAAFGRAWQGECASDAEGFTAAAAVFLAWIVELETFIQAFAHEIELGPVDVRQAFRIDQHLHAMTFEDHILGCKVVCVFQLVGQTRATCGLHAQPHPHALAAFGDVARYVACRSFGQGDSHWSMRLLGLVVVHRGLDRVFRQDRTVNLDRR